MKLIVAMIQPHKLPDVKMALYDAEVYRMTVTNALGCGQQKGYHESYRGADVEVNLLNMQNRTSFQHNVKYCLELLKFLQSCIVLS